MRRLRSARVCWDRLWACISADRCVPGGSQGGNMGCTAPLPRACFASPSLRCCFPSFHFYFGVISAHLRVSFLRVCAHSVWRRPHRVVPSHCGERDFAGQLRSTRHICMSGPLPPGALPCAVCSPSTVFSTCTPHTIIRFHDVMLHSAPICQPRCRWRLFPPTSSSTVHRAPHDSPIPHP